MGRVRKRTELFSVLVGFVGWPVLGRSPCMLFPAALAECFGDVVMDNHPLSTMTQAIVLLTSNFARVLRVPCQYLRLVICMSRPALVQGVPVWSAGIYVASAFGQHASMLWLTHTMVVP